MALTWMTISQCDGAHWMTIVGARPIFITKDLLGSAARLEIPAPKKHEGRPEAALKF